MKTMGPRGEERDESSKGKATSEQARIESKIVVTTYACNKLLLIANIKLP